MVPSESLQIVQNLTTQTSDDVSDVANRTTSIDCNLRVALQMLNRIDYNISSAVTRDWTPDGASPLRVHDYVGEFSVLPRQTVITPNVSITLCYIFLLVEW